MPVALEMVESNANKQTKRNSNKNPARKITVSVVGVLEHQECRLDPARHEAMPGEPPGQVQPVAVQKGRAVPPASPNLSV